MDQEWVKKSLGQLKEKVPNWLIQIKEFEPTYDFYSRLSAHKSIPGIVQEICSNIGLQVSPTIEIVGDSDVTTLDFNTGRRFDEKEINSAADIRSTSFVSMKIRIGVHQISGPRNLGHILAHESAHHFMSVANIHAESDFENEMLTDLTAVYIGFGKLMLNGAQEDTMEIITKPIHLSDQGIPYLGYPLLTYAYLVCQKERGHSQEQIFTNLNDPCASYLRSFEFYSRRKNTFWNKIARFFLDIEEAPDCNGRVICEEALRLNPNKHNIVRCISCNISLRIPKSNKKLRVTCPKCKKSFTVIPRY